MPSTLTALFIILFAIVPGVLGEKFYRALGGVDWRADQWRKALRVICVSIAGLIIYVVVAHLVGWSMPAYVIPSTFSAANFRPELLPTIATTYAGHMFFAVVAGAVAGIAQRGVHRMSSVSSCPDTWDVFARDLVSNHWVVVTLTSGEAYMGILEKADISVQQSERDIILAEPAQYVEEKADYRTLRYQYLFIPGALIGSVAVYYDPAVDQRTTPVDHELFSGRPHERQDQPQID